jgi:hypothetical protein
MFAAKQYGFSRKGEAPNVPSLTVDGALTVGGRVTGAGFTSSIDGSAATPAYNFTNNTNMGWYRNVADVMRGVVAGADQVSISSGLFQALQAFAVSGQANIGSSQLLLTSIVTPAVIGSTQNNYAGASGTINRLASDFSPRVITGMTAGVAGGHTKWLWNVNSSVGFTLQLNNEDAGSTAANRFLTDTGGNIILSGGQIAIAIYDSTVSRWRVSIT